MPKKEVEIYTRGARKLKVLLPESKLTKSQKIRKIRSLSDGSRFVLTIRYDDECGNGKNSFSMITSRERQKRDGEWVMTSGGCADHSEIEKYFPNLKHLVKWHLFDTSGPMHYLANTLYHAEEVEGGQVIGYEERLKFRGFPMTFKINKAFFQFLKERQEHGSNWDHEIYPVAYRKRPGNDYKFGPKWTFLPYEADDWYKAPFDTEEEAVEFQKCLKECGGFETVKIPNRWTEEKKADIEAARRSAVWPEATLEQLQNESLLVERLPSQVEEFKNDIERLGFTY